MSEPFVAEIRMWALNFAPRGWAFCNGQLLPIAQNTALFSLIGTTYGGDGRSTMGLPNLQGRAAMHPGRGPGLTARRLGETGGNAMGFVTQAQMPSHNHALNASTEQADLSSPGASRLLARSSSGFAYTNAGTSSGMDAGSLPPAGGGNPHNNLQPYLGINFTIALVGLYPSRS